MVRVENYAGVTDLPLTPIDIQNKEFSRSMRGLSASEVDEFLERVAKDFEELIKENISAKEQMSQLKEKLSHYHKLEETLHNAIVVAQETAEEVKRNASKEADLIRREAEKDANRMLDEARYKASRILADQDEVYKQAQIYKMRFRSLVEAQLAALEMEDWITLDEQSEEEARRGA
ncbi:DivIVA family protein [Dethiobacter alkaliphilus AHT 1]|uniref:DivIVA family protein n=1 Tax=Dethiobacter alkaliphilus AHT 1 TaxID=555088 RepID=C0GJQ7_DETAL|nr:DivIVA family protein [Dethiobacter alkaliphilus AHT 1]